MKQFNSRIIPPALITLLGVLWVVVGLTEYGWWGEKGPTTGFFPIITGALLAFVGVLAFNSERKQKAPKYHLANMFPLFGVLATVAAAMLIGFFPAMLLYVFLWLKVYEKYSLLFSTMVSVITTLAMYGIFALWLRVPFPAGVIMNAIIG